MAEDNSSCASIPPVFQQNSSLESIVEITESKQLDSSSTSSALLSSSKKNCRLVDWNSHAAVRKDAIMSLPKQSAE